MMGCHRRDGLTKISSPCFCYSLWFLHRTLQLVSGWLICCQEDAVRADKPVS